MRPVNEESAVPALRIAHLITGLGVGGSERMLARLVGSLGSPAQHLVVCLTGRGAVADEIERDGVTVVELGMRAGPSLVAGLWRAWRTLRAYRPDVLQTWMYHGDLLGTLLQPFVGRPALVWNLRSADVDLSLYGPGTAAIRRALAVLSGRPDAIVANSIAGIESHRDCGYDARRWEHVPNGVDLARFVPRSASRASLRASLGLEDNAPLVGYVGRNDPAKNLPGLLAAFASARRHRAGARLLILGPGSTSLTSEVARAGLGDAVLLRAACPNPEHVYPALDVFVLASRFEGFPNVVAEAMACGVPCVTTDAGDCAGIVGETGLVVPRDDDDALATALADALAWTPRERARRGTAARARIAERFALDNIAARYAALWSDLSRRAAPAD